VRQHVPQSHTAPTHARCRARTAVHGKHIRNIVHLRHGRSTHRAHDLRSTLKQVWILTGIQGGTAGASPRERRATASSLRHLDVGREGHATCECFLTSVWTESSIGQGIHNCLACCAWYHFLIGEELAHALTWHVRLSTSMDRRLVSTAIALCSLHVGPEG